MEINNLCDSHAHTVVRRYVEGESETRDAMMYTKRMVECR